MTAFLLVEQKPMRVATPLWMRLYLAAMLLGTFISGLRTLGSTGVWTLGDWLINYSGGFVRRGLAGTIALSLQRVSHIRAGILVVAFAMLLYLCVFACIYYLARNVRWTFWTVAAFIAPTAVAYPFVSTSGYHKEVLFFAVFALLLCRLLYLRQRGLHLSWRESLALAAASIFGVLTHELFAIYFPYILAGLLIGEADWRRAIRLAVIPALSASLALASVTSHPGNAALAQTVCDSLGAQNHAVCAGSIAYLGHTREEARAETVFSVQEYHYFAFMPPLALLGLLPLFASFNTLRGIPARTWRILLAAIALSCTLSLLLFFYGADWGRWIEIHLFSLFLLLLFMAALYDAENIAERSPRLSWARIFQGAVLLVYATCWSLPGTTNTPKGGYLSMFGRVSVRLFGHLKGI